VDFVIPQAAREAIDLDGRNIFIIASSRGALYRNDPLASASDWT
jgi:hypothetical protein